MAGLQNLLVWNAYTSYFLGIYVIHLHHLIEKKKFFNNCMHVFLRTFWGGGSGEEEGRCSDRRERERRLLMIT